MENLRKKSVIIFRSQNKTATSYQGQAQGSIAVALIGFVLSPLQIDHNNQVN